MEEVRVKPIVRPLTHIAKEIRDPRFDQGKRYPLAACLLLVWAGLLCGQENLNLIAKWGKKLSVDFLKILGFKNGIAPSKSTLYDLMPRLDPYELEVRLGNWAESVCLELDIECELPNEKKPLAGIAVDGKTLRGSKKQGALFSHLLSAVVHKIGITLFQVPVSDKTNEIPIMEDLLRELFLEGRVVTMDALLAQRDIAQQIIDSGADYLMNVKLNQPTLHNQIKDLFDPNDESRINQQPANSEANEQSQLLTNSSQFNEPLALARINAQETDQTMETADQEQKGSSLPIKADQSHRINDVMTTTKVIEQTNETQDPCQSKSVKPASQVQKKNQFGYACTIDRGHGRVDIRILRASDILNSQLNWPHVGQVLTTRRIRINKATGEILSDQSHYYITSLSPEEATASDLLDLCRDHWTIENKSHYVRDVTFGEDASQVRKGPLPQIMAAFRNTIICALRRLGVSSIKGSLAENSANPFTVFTYLAM